ncbi:hypothetical protein [Bacillus sp. B15-48]|uniref:hypothetical protein n=1 Tax=Bacillus sp. B15-48 TaxID=1548601 RepID=UPI00193F6292|nr:hypothetical protein [Bacillus sp. B15-48]MBM4763826.1 hypothetical protein [Bacillus sp. B15-48]
MGRQIKGLIYFFLTDIRYSLMIFWSILLIILVLSLGIANFLLGVENGVYFLSLDFPIYVYCAILGFLTVKEAIPFSIKMGATRKNLYIALGLFFFGLAFVKSVISSTLQSLTLAFTNAAGISSFKFLYLSPLMENAWFSSVAIDTAIMFFLLSIMFILGLLFYQTGLAGGGITVGVLFLILLHGIAQGWIIEFFINQFTEPQMTFFYQLLAVGVIFYGISYGFIRKITIIKTR